MTTTIRLARRAYGALRLLEGRNFEKRAKQLESIGERGFGLLLYWNQIESALKLAHYGYSIKDRWPEKLSFLGTTWKLLQCLKEDDPRKYETVLGGSNNSLWKTRNEIAHEGRNVAIDSYNTYVEAAIWVIAELQKEMPNLEQLKEKKRRSYAQLLRKQQGQD